MTRADHQNGNRPAAGWAALAVAVATAVVAVVLPAAAGAYSSPENKLGYSACAWPAGQVIRVGVDPAFPFPDSGFSDRLNEAIARWNGALAATARKVGMQRADEAPQVVVQYRATEGADADDVLGETYLQREGDPEMSADIGRCPDRRAAVHTMKAAQIRINPRSDWFTGHDSTVERWQMCDSESFRVTNPVLCGDQVDFASTMIHELGHAMVFYHPQTLDDIDGVPIDRADSASNAARCVEATGSFAAQATMCAGQGVWRGEQRTLEAWDTDTAQRHYI